MTPELKNKIVAASRGTMTGALVACALGLERDALPRYVGTGIITSDGWLMCNFVDRDGTFHPGAFVGAADDLAANIAHLARYMKLGEADGKELAKIMGDWIGQNYRAQRQQAVR